MADQKQAASPGAAPFRCEHGCPAAEVCKVVKGGHAGPCKGSHGVAPTDELKGNDRA